MIGFYASVRDGVRTGFLLGPYDDHEEALGAVDKARTLAARVDDRAHFYAFGTARVEADRLPTGRLNHLSEEAA